jgi:hypothetical protein
MKLKKMTRTVNIPLEEYNSLIEFKDKIENDNTIAILVSLDKCYTVRYLTHYDTIEELTKVNKELAEENDKLHKFIKGKKRWWHLT